MARSADRNSFKVFERLGNADTAMCPDFGSARRSTGSYYSLQLIALERGLGSANRLRDLVGRRYQDFTYLVSRMQSLKWQHNNMSNDGFRYAAFV